LKLDTTQLHISIVDETQVGYQASTLVICLVMTFTSSSHYLTNYLSKWVRHDVKHLFQILFLC